MIAMRAVKLSLVCVSTVLLLACSDDAASTSNSGTGSTDSGIASLSGDADAGDGDPGGDGEPDPGECGNGVVEGTEQCDDGNLQDNDGCSATCTDETGQMLPCGGKIYACGDTIDNDGDGKIDGMDPECTSPCDDDEGTFQTALPGQNVDCWSDCYWDGDSGAGNDKCEWNLKCDPENPGAGTNCEYDPNWGMCDLEQPNPCIDICSPITPNGCDCFGCCEINGLFIYLGNGSCALDNLDACETCTFHEGCNNPCEPELCELCFGQDPSELPEECGPDPACPDGFDSCTVDADCQDGWFCQTGCCIPIDIQ